MKMAIIVNIRWKKETTKNYFSCSLLVSVLRSEKKIKRCQWNTRTSLKPSIFCCQWKFIWLTNKHRTINWHFVHWVCVNIFREKMKAKHTIETRKTEWKCSKKWRGKQNWNWNPSPTTILLLFIVAYFFL